MTRGNPDVTWTAPARTGTGAAAAITKPQHSLYELEHELLELYITAVQF